MHVHALWLKGLSTAHATHTPSIAPAHPQPFALTFFPLAAAVHWEPCLPLSVSLLQSYQYWSERQGAPGHLRGHWPSACNWKELIARPNPKAVIVPSACILGVTMTPSILPPASLLSRRSCISQMVLWTEKCFSYRISSVRRPHWFCQAVPLLWGKHKVCCSAASTGQRCPTQQNPFRQLPSLEIETDSTPPAPVTKIQGE